MVQTVVGAFLVVHGLITTMIGVVGITSPNAPALAMPSWLGWWQGPFGRSWLFARIREFLSGRPGRFLVVGGPGSGKTAIAARLATEVRQVSTAMRAAFRVVLLDEYQDTSAAQAIMLRGLFSGRTAADGRGQPVTAVGDPFQAIYGWRGAAASNILTFADDFPRSDGRPAHHFALTVNRRSGRAVLDVANVLS